MSKSAGPGVFLDLDANEMCGAIMAQPDGMMESLFINCTRIPLGEKDAIFNLGPKDAKMRIAREIVGLFHGQQAAEAAESNFVETFSNRGIPSDIETIGASIGERLVDILLSQKVIESKTEWRRLVDSGAVTNAETGEKVTSHDVTLTAPITLKVGKRRFLKINTN
jgi:tyrosyl-tRNA synthetase